MLALLIFTPLLSGCVNHAGPSYLAGSTELECAPYARQRSGIDLHGEAADWWRAAAGRYARAQVPAPGGVLVFQPSERLPSGHVSVVARVVGRREILVDQANWVHRRIGRGEPVYDVSPTNDWSEVRVWWSPAGRLGVAIYPTYGFILAEPARVAVLD